MDTQTLLIIVLLAALVILYFSRLGTRPSTTGSSGGELPPGPSTFVFVPLEAGVLKRPVTIIAPDQMVDGKLHKLLVEAQPLPPDPPQPPPKEKGIDGLITAVIHPRVRYADTLETVYAFDPPLTIAVNYADEDAKKSGSTGDRPNLSIVTFYQDREVWRWQKLATDIDVAAKTLTAKLDTLTPKDPVGMGAP